MGKGFLKERNKVRSTQYNQIVREVQRLEAENHALKTNPEGVVGRFLKNLNLCQAQNHKLTALAASFIQTAGGSLSLSRSLMESFDNHRVIIRVEPDAEKEEDIKNYLFTYESHDMNAAPEVVTTADPTPAPDAPITVEQHQATPLPITEETNGI